MPNTEELRRERGRRMPRISVSPMAGIMTLGMIAAIAFGREELVPWLAIFFAATIHELGHLLMAWTCRVRVSELRLDILGARIRMDGLMSYTTEWLVAVGGPAVNLATALAVYPFLVREGHSAEGWLFWFFTASLGLGLLNLLPVGTMDGGRMLHCLLSGVLGERIAAVCLRVTTCVCLVALWMTSVYVLLRAGQMLSLFAFSMCLLLRFAVPDPGQTERTL